MDGTGGKGQPIKLWVDGQEIKGARLLSLSIYVEAPDDTCLSRRLARDVKERGRTRQSVLAQYERTVRPMAEAYVLPTQQHADLIIDGRAPVEESVARILAAYGTLSS